MWVVAAELHNWSVPSVTVPPKAAFPEESIVALDCPPTLEESSHIAIRSFSGPEPAATPPPPPAPSDAEVILP